MADSVSQIGERIRTLRKRAGITQADLAAAIDVDAQTVARWERGERRPGAEAFESAVNYLNTVIGGLSHDVRRGTFRPASAVAETLAVREEATAYVVPVWLNQRAESLDRELARGGATDAQIDYIKSLMRSEATLKFVLYDDDGAQRPLGDQQKQLELFIEGMRFWLRSSTPGGAPVAPVTAVPEPGTQANAAQPRGRKQ